MIYFVTHARAARTGERAAPALSHKVCVLPVARTRPGVYYIHQKPGCAGQRNKCDTFSTAASRCPAASLRLVSLAHK